MQLLLASTSPFRAAILQTLRLPFTTARPEVDESPLAGEEPAQLVERLAVAKAQAVAADAGTFVIGSDQVATIDGDILGKPHTVERAVAQLMRFSGRRVLFLTGLCLRRGEVVHSVVERFARSVRRRCALMWRWNRRSTARAVSSRKGWAFCFSTLCWGAIRMP